MFVFVYSSYHLNLQIVLNTQKNPYLNQATPEKMLAKFFYPKKSFDHACHLKSGVPPWAAPHPFTFLNS